MLRYTDWRRRLLLFFDFAGYTMMAMGVGAIFGIEVPRNFRAPFASVDIKDFWNRWNMTLSFWLRDFVFMRLTRGLVMRHMFASRLTAGRTGRAGAVGAFTVVGIVARPFAFARSGAR